MFHKILAAIDNSTLSEQAFAEALNLAKAMNADLMLLHILSPEEEDSPNYTLPIGWEYVPSIANEMIELRQQQWQTFRDKSAMMLRSRAAQAKAAGVNVDVTQDTGIPDRSICEFAKSWGADVIILGRRGHAGLGELFLGSVSNYVVHHAPCSVLVVQGEALEATSEASDEAQTMQSH
jgi:nucleotide-binding universal stress UspA family protein